MSESKKYSRRGRFAIRFGALLLIIPFFILPLEYWYVYHHAPNSICIPTRGLAYQKLHLDSFFDIVIFLTEGLFTVPGAILLAVATFKSVTIRFAIPPVLFVLIFVFLAMETGSLSRSWPNPIFPEDALKVYHEELKASE